MSLALVLLNIKYLNIRLARVLKYFTLIFQKYFTYDNASQPCLYHSLSLAQKVCISGDYTNVLSNLKHIMLICKKNLKSFVEFNQLKRYQKCFLNNLKNDFWPLWEKLKVPTLKHDFQCRTLLSTIRKLLFKLILQIFLGPNLTVL